VRQLMHPAMVFGAVLLRVQPDGRRSPIAYASRALTDGENRYAPGYVRSLHSRTTAVVNACREIFDGHRIAEQLITGNGPQYTSEEFRAFAREYAFDHATSSPCTLSGGKRSGRTLSLLTLKRLMQKFEKAGSDFQFALLALRTSPNNSTNFSPAQLLIGRRLRFRLPALPVL
jgi:transposase InsO family protein